MAKPSDITSASSREGQAIEVLESRTHGSAQKATRSYFLSYAGIDREAASSIAKGLQHEGVRIWWDQEGLGWGDRWIEKLEQTLADCAGFIILLGRSGVRKWVKFELSLAIKRHIEHDFPLYPLLMRGVTPEMLPPFLATLQGRTIPADLSDSGFYHELSQHLLAQPSGGDTSELPASAPSQICPFPGLEAFGESTAKFFFGRQQETLDAVNGLGLGLDRVYRRWLQVEGTSGVGKSSLVKAGIIPAIKAGWAGSAEVEHWTTWRVVDPMRPGTDCLLNLAQVLTTCLGDAGRQLTVSECYDRFQQDDIALQVLLREWTVDREAIVLVIDQLEELFTLSKEPGIAARMDILLANALADLDGPLHLVTTIRSDFLMQFGLLPRLQSLLQQQRASRYLLAHIGKHGLHDVVYTPAKLAGLTWSDEELPREIVQEASGEPGALPLVENLLRLLWLEAHKRQDHRLDRVDYNELGGVGGALAKSADDLLNSFGTKKSHAFHLLSALVLLGSSGKDRNDARQTIPKSQALRAAGGGAQAEEILNQLSGLRGPDTPVGELARPRLVVLSTGTHQGVTTDLVDLAHETLLRYDRNGKPFWGTFRDELDHRKENLSNRQLADDLAQDWMAKGRSRWRGLLTWRQIRTFGRLPDLSESALAYVRASRWGRMVTTLVLSLPFVLIIASLAWMAKEGATPQYAQSIAMAWLGLVDVHEPVMVPLPAGTFRQGDVEGRGGPYEKPVRNVTVEAFAIGKHEVTFEAYEQYVEMTGEGRIEDKGWGKGDRPAINVSWEDAKGYVTWLAHATGNAYRLPTESEWEYAARGNKQHTWAGTSDEAELSDYAVFAKSKTEPVGSKRANDFGLHDMSGNVEEWVEDCWHQNYLRAPTNGSAWLEADGGDCSLRVLRGGSWNIHANFLRSSYRSRFTMGVRYSGVGFRVVQAGSP